MFRQGHSFTASRYLGHLLVALAALLVLHAFIRTYIVASYSMAPTLVPGERIWVSRLAYHGGRLPAHGDLIAFRAPTWADPQQRTFIERVVGLPGDRIGMRDGKLYRNGQPLSDVGAMRGGLSWPAEGTILLAARGQPEELVHEGEMTVPDGMLFVTAGSDGTPDDSRTWTAVGSDGQTYLCPFVPRDRVTGKVVAIIWPLGKAGRVR